MHAAALMRELRIKKVIIPMQPAVFSALGMLLTDLRRDYLRTHITRTDLVEPAELDAIFKENEIHVVFPSCLGAQPRLYFGEDNQQTEVLEDVAHWATFGCRNFTARRQASPHVFTQNGRLQRGTYIR